MKSREDRLHFLGALLMWGGPLLAGAGVFYVSMLSTIQLFTLFLLALISGLGGAYLKKRNCPHCRTGVCHLDTKKL